MSMASYIAAAPKAELHVHLEGSIRPETLLTLARRHGVELPGETVEALRRWFHFTTFEHFIEVYVTITRCLREAEDYELIVVELARELAAQRGRYAEVTFSPSTHEMLGVSREAYLTGLARGRERALAEHGVRINWVFDIVRMEAERRAKWAEVTLEAALEAREIGVVAFGLGGFEAPHPPEDYARWFDRAREARLHSAPHAGETAGPASIRGAIEALGAERIGHGVRAIEDPALVERLAEARIPLEVCPTSNLCIGVYPTLAAHPLRALVDAGVAVTVASDDPPLFNTTLTGELQLLDSAFDLPVEKVDEILLNGVRFSFLPDAEKAALLKGFEAELGRLKAAHLQE